MPALDAPILVVDDDPKIVALVRTYLERERFRVATAAEGDTALRAIQDLRPRLVVLDLMLPGLDGLSIIREARDLGDIPILVVSARGTTGDRIVGLAEGADDYLPKPFSPAELVVRVRAILRRAEGRHAAGRPLRMAGLELDMARDRATLGGRDIDLSVLERRLLAAVMQAEGRTMTREQLLDAIHGIGQSDAFDRAIDVYVKRLRRKLGDDPIRPRFIATVRGVGYRAASPVEG
ncbi:MAG TPA: response regulator transcription factor [Candidatus Limnocylindrales bacterium]|nr:response regulator transcription factor [Candidatus Limnocylindrales bacterium]